VHYGTTILTFLTKWSIQSGDGILGHNFNIGFLFFEPFRPVLALRLSKSANNSNTNAMLSSNPLKRGQKSSPQKSYRGKTFAHSQKKVKKLNFSVTFSLIIFFA
jgi:hypothetical protein